MIQALIFYSYKIFLLLRNSQKLFLPEVVIQTAFIPFSYQPQILNMNKIHLKIK